MTIKTYVHEPVRIRAKHSIQEYIHKEGAGVLPDGWCILRDETTGATLTDSEGNVLVVLCT